VASLKVLNPHAGKAARERLSRGQLGEPVATCAIDLMARSLFAGHAILLLDEIVALDKVEPPEFLKSLVKLRRIAELTDTDVRLGRNHRVVRHFFGGVLQHEPSALMPTTQVRSAPSITPGTPNFSTLAISALGRDRAR
jgi:hypothetical protein